MSMLPADAHRRLAVAPREVGYVLGSRRRGAIMIASKLREIANHLDVQGNEHVGGELRIGVVGDVLHIDTNLRFRAIK